MPSDHVFAIIIHEGTLQGLSSSILCLHPHAHLPSLYFCYPWVYPMYSVCIIDHLQISANNMNGKQQKVQSGVTDTDREAGMYPIDSLSLRLLFPGSVGIRGVSPIS